MTFFLKFFLLSFLFALATSTNSTIFGKRCPTIEDTRNNYKPSVCHALNVSEPELRQDYKCCYLQVDGSFEGIKYSQSTCIEFYKSAAVIKEKIEEVRSKIKLDTFNVQIDCASKYLIINYVINIMFILLVLYI